MDSPGNLGKYLLNRWITWIASRILSMIEVDSAEDEPVVDLGGEEILSIDLGNSSPLLYLRRRQCLSHLFHGCQRELEAALN